MVNLNKKRLLTLALLLFTFASMLMAQTMKITGSVVDQHGDPLIGVSVIQKGTSKGSVTDLDGKFVIETLRGATLEFSYIGFNTQDVKVNGESINIHMKENSKVLNDVVVVGYGIQKKSSVTGAISQVKAGDLENRTITDANAALQGKTSGVQVISTTAAPGSTPTIRIRGYSSNVSSNPLYVVDGVRTTDISGIDPNDIASMEILKDAASAAIYGSEAGNGVILITTKKGKAGEGKISYDFQYTDQSVAHVPQVMNAEQYINYMTEAGTFTKNYLLKNWDGITNTNWSDVAFEHSPMVKHNLSFAGGSDKGNYYLSLSYLNNNGIVTGNNDYYHRLTATINAEHRFKEWIKVGTTNQIEKYDTRSVASNSEYGSVMTSVMTMDPLTPATYSGNNLPYFMANAIANGKALLTDKNGNYYGISRFCSGEEYNPLIMTNNNNTRTSGFVVNGSIYADITPIKNLTFTSRFGYRLTGYRYSKASLPFYANGTQSNDYVGLSSTSSTTIYYQWENFANYMKSFHGHTITAMLGTSYQDQSYNYTTGNLTANGENAVTENNPLFYYLNYATASSVKGVAGETTRTAKLSYF
ncbi:MAG TPA: SusC/RagA family protein, partial [Prevotella sp.]|nr:SusC/RagA family protein [Prevotella sp.]